MTVFLATLQVQPAAEGMTPAAWIFMLTVWALVIWLNIFAFRRIFTTERHFDPDGTGPEHPPMPPTREDG